MMVMSHWGAGPPLSAVGQSVVVLSKPHKLEHSAGSTPVSRLHFKKGKTHMSTVVKNIKREHAEARQREYDALTTEQKLARLDSRPGESKRERARLAKG